MKKAVFAGSFDPPTVGHEEVVRNSSEIFDKVIVAVLENPQKSSLLTVEERVNLLKKLFAQNPAVEVISFNGAAVDLLEREGTPFYVRGVRDTIDFEYETRNFFASKKLKNDIITIYIPSSQENLHVSSTLVRNSLHFKKEYRALLPEMIADDICALLEEKDV
ncbi:MAG: pantetheine-phosphate adenylyltransferase [Candidatus Coproplasma sp.]